ncbi:MAG: M14 family zinc carboxypeptidase [Candidatus Thermoplasmatota archaeon]|nr:M14 family zinc carboxypeptidase [Candidatus Thermoplasmatota archaeon]
MRSRRTVNITGRSSIWLTMMICSILLVSGGQIKGDGIFPDGAEAVRTGRISFPSTLSQEANFSTYFDYRSMTDYLRFLEGEYPDLVKLWSLGQTYEGREIWCIKLSDRVELVDDGHPGSEPDALLVGAHHANEWISYEVPLFIITFLLENYGGDDDNGSIATFLMDNREIFFVPILNADGVQYAHDVDRGWRKNREPNYIGEFGPAHIISPDLLPVSYGVDINRNYGWMWHEAGGSNVVVTSGSSYRGPPDNRDDDGDAIFQIDLTPGFLPFGPDEGVDEDPWDGIDNDGDGKVDEDPAGGFTSLESIAMRELGDEHAFPVAITYHSYSELVLWPWGYSGETTKDDAVLSQLGARMAEMNGYRPMQGESLYKVTGEFTDWFYSQYGTFGYTFEIGRTHNIPGEEIRSHCELNLDPSLFLIHAADNPYESFIRFDENSSSFNIERNSIALQFSYEDMGYPKPISADGSRVAYRWDGGLWDEEEVEFREDGNITCSISRRREGGSLEYYLVLEDSDSKTVTYPTYAPNQALLLEFEGDSIFQIYFGMDTILILTFTLGIVWGGFSVGIFKAMGSGKKRRQDIGS